MNVFTHCRALRLRSLRSSADPEALQAHTRLLAASSTARACPQGRPCVFDMVHYELLRQRDSDLSTVHDGRLQWLLTYPALFAHVRATVAIKVKVALKVFLMLAFSCSRCSPPALGCAGFTSTLRSCQGALVRHGHVFFLSKPQR